MNGPSPERLSFSEGWADGFEAGKRYVERQSQDRTDGIAARLNLALLNAGKKRLEATRPDRLSSGSSVIWETVKWNHVLVESYYVGGEDRFVTLNGTWTFAGSDRHPVHTTIPVPLQEFQTICRKAMKEN